MAMGLSHAFETRYRRRSLPGRPLYEDESERISIMARSHLTPLKAEYIGADQLPFFFLRLQLCGGPYIPVKAFTGTRPLNL